MVLGKGMAYLRDGRLWNPSRTFRFPDGEVTEVALGTEEEFFPADGDGADVISTPKRGNIGTKTLAENSPEDRKAKISAKLTVGAEQGRFFF